MVITPPEGASDQAVLRKHLDKWQGDTKKLYNEALSRNCWGDGRVKQQALDTKHIYKIVIGIHEANSPLG